MAERFKKELENEEHLLESIDHKCRDGDKTMWKDAQLESYREGWCSRVLD